MLLGHNGIRCDSWGDGHYGSRRTKLNGSVYSHKGVDYLYEPGQPVIVNVDAEFVRIVMPYADSREYTGMHLKTEWCEFRLFYVKPEGMSFDSNIKQGDIIGKAQDISKRYGFNSKGQKMDNHVHVEIVSIDPDFISKVLEVGNGRLYKNC